MIRKDIIRWLAVAGAIPVGAFCGFLCGYYLCLGILSLQGKGNSHDDVYTVLGAGGLLTSLLRRGVTHVFNSWAAMPPISEQMALPGCRTNPKLVAARFLLKSRQVPGRLLGGTQFLAQETLQRSSSRSWSVCPSRKTILIAPGRRCFRS